MAHLDHAIHRLREFTRVQLTIWRVEPTCKHSLPTAVFEMRRATLPLQHPILPLSKEFEFANVVPLMLTVGLAYLALRPVSLYSAQRQSRSSGEGVSMLRGMRVHHIFVTNHDVRTLKYAAFRGMMMGKSISVSATSLM